MDYFDEQNGVEAELTANKKETSGEGQLTVDVFQTDKEIVIKSTIAGVGQDDIDISVTSEMVTIRGTRQSEEKVKNSDYYHQELYWGSFSRTVILPEEIDVDAAKASIKNGLLTLRLPKLARNRTKKLKISS